MIAQVPVLSGEWSDKVKWELFASKEEPPAELCTAVFCVAVTEDKKIVLARSKRGWGLIGGHVEEGETLKDALVRESQEEGGFTPSQPQVFAHQKVTATEPALHQNSARKYPFPVSYQVFYWATTTEPIVLPDGEEILESASFTPEEIAALNIPDQAMIELGYEAYLLKTS